MGIQQILPETGETVIDIPAQPAGSLRFTCGMGMYGGAIEFKDASAAGATQPQATDPSQRASALDQDDPSFIGPVLPKQAAPSAVVGQSNSATQVVMINVSDYGYEPPAARAKANAPVRLVLQTQGAYG